MSREHFRETGALYDCPNPLHSRVIGKYLVATRWAKGSWSDILDDGRMATYALSFAKVEDPSGEVVWKLIIWKLSVYWAVIRNE